MQPSRATTRSPTTPARALGHARALRKLGPQPGRIEHTCRYAPRRTRSSCSRTAADAGRDLPAAERLRARRPRRPLTPYRVHRSARGRNEHKSMVGHAMKEAAGSSPGGRRSRSSARARGRGGARLGQPRPRYLLDEPRGWPWKKSGEAPAAVAGPCGHPHIGFLLVRSDVIGLWRSVPRRVHYLVDSRMDGDDPLALLRECPAPPPPHRRIPHVSGHHGQQFLRPGAR